MKLFASKFPVHEPGCFDTHPQPYKPHVIKLCSARSPHIEPTRLLLDRQRIGRARSRMWPSDFKALYGVQILNIKVSAV